MRRGGKIPELKKWYVANKHAAFYATSYSNIGENRLNGSSWRALIGKAL